MNFNRNFFFSRTDNYVDLDSKFEANIINSTVYLISMAMQLSTFAVNYKVGALVEFKVMYSVKKR